MDNKLLNYSALGVATLALLVALVSVLGGVGLPTGGTTNYDQLDTTDGYSVDGTSIINGSGVFTGTINTTSASGTFASYVVLDGIVWGATGKTTDTTSTSTLTLTAAQVCNNAFFEWTPSVAKATTTLPNASDVVSDCATTNGWSKRILVKNLGDTASSSFLLDRISTGMNLLFASSTGADASSTMYGGTFAILDLFRASSTQIDVGVNIYEK